MVKAVLAMVCRVVAVILLVYPAGVSAQMPDFSGTWMFDAAASTGVPRLPAIGGSAGLPASALGGAGRGAPAGTFDPNTGRRSIGQIDINQLVIKQSPADMQVRNGGIDLVYKLDGTEANISALRRPGFPRGKAVWEDATLVITTKQSVYIGNNQYEDRITREAYQLQDGTLVIQRNQPGPDGKPEEAKLVYRRAAS